MTDTSTDEEEARVLEILDGARKGPVGLTIPDADVRDLCTLALERLASRQAVVPLVWRAVEGFKGIYEASSPLGLYRVDDAFQTPSVEGMKIVLPSWMGPAPAANRHECVSVEEAKKQAQADYTQRINSAIAVPVRDETEIRVAAALKAIRDAQDILAEYIVPDSGISDFDCINRLLGVLDAQELVRALAQTKPEGETK